MGVQGMRNQVWGHYQLDEYFIQCILKNQEPKITAEDAVKVIGVASKIVKQKRAGFRLASRDRHSLFQYGRVHLTGSECLSGPDVVY
jgi:hypothetical protein